MTGAYVGAPPLGKRHRANRAEHDGVSMAAVWAALIAKKKPRLWVEPGLSTGTARGVNKRGTEILHGGTRLFYMSCDVFHSWTRGNSKPRPDGDRGEVGYRRRACSAKRLSGCMTKVPEEETADPRRR
jgi:hypothetical protein